MKSSRGHRRVLIAALCALAGFITATPAYAAAAGDTLLTSGMPIPAGSLASSGSGRSTDGEPGAASVSANGRYVAFLSDDDDLAPSIQPDAASIFRKDRVTGAVELISRTTGTGGIALPAVVADPVISNDGNRVGWISDAAFDPADTDGQTDVYIRDVAAGTTTLATPGTAAGILNFDLSGDGNWIAFSSPDVLAGIDGNGASDIFRRNLTTGAIALASATDGTATAGNDASSRPSISDDGLWVAFASRATNLVLGYASGGATLNVYARRMSSVATVLISARFSGMVTGGNGDSDEPIIIGQPTTGSTLRVGYTSRATNLADNAVTDTSSGDSAYVRQYWINASVLISRATGPSGANADSGAYLTGISDDGQRAVFSSSASNLPGATGSSSYGSFLRDLGANTTTRISGASSYGVNPAISGDGTFATWFELGAAAEFDPELSGVFGRAVPTGSIELVSRPAGSAPLVAAAPTVGSPQAGVRTVSGDGRYVVFSARGAGLGAGGTDQVYRRDLRTNELVLVSRATGENGAASSRFASNATISASGSRVTFTTAASLDPADTNTTVDVYVRDIDAGTTTLVSRANGADGAVSNGQVEAPSISASGQQVVFRSAATNFGVADGKGHIYVRDLAAGTTVLADRASGAGGAIAADGAEAPQPSADGRLVVFESRSANLSPDDPSGTSNDIYLRDLVANTTTLLSRRPGLAGAKLTGASSYPAISSDGSTVAFKTSDQLAAPEAGPWGGTDQVVVRKIATGENVLASRVAGGAPGDRDSTTPSLNADGTVVAFSGDASNLLPGRGSATSYRDAVFAKNLVTGAISGPPAFGLALDWAQQRATYPSISEDGQCMAFIARGHNAVTGKAGDVRSAYLNVVSGSCPKPAPAVATPTSAPTPAAATPAAQLSGVSLTNRRFKVGAGRTPLIATGARGAPKRKTPTGTTFRFTLNTSATVRIAILQRVTGRKVGKQCLKTTPKRKRLKPCKRFAEIGKLERTGVAAGARSVGFSGRLGTRKLPAGSYQARLIASTSGGSSAPVTVAFTIVPR